MKLWGKKKPAAEIPLGQAAESYFRWAERPTAPGEVQNPKALLGAEVFQAFVRRAMEEKREALPLLAPSLEKMDLMQACLGAHLCGALIEGAGVGEAGRPVVALFARVAVLACEFLADVETQLGLADGALESADLERANLAALFAAAPDRVRAYLGLDLVTLAAMAAITRDIPSRLYLRQRGIYQHLQFLQHFSPNVGYVVQVHDACPQLPLTVLAPGMGRGFQMEANDLSNCFHLFTLLEAEIYRKGWAGPYALAGYAWEEDIYQIATGAAYPQRDYSISAHQQYFLPKALQADGSYRVTLEGPQGRQMDPEALVWGEMPPEAIPALEGERVILMDGKGMFGGRTWDVGFIAKCHDALNPYVRVLSELSTASYEALLQKARRYQP